MSEPLFEARAIRKIFGNGNKQIEVLKGIDLTLRPGEMTGIVGASGSGKTTLLQTLGTLAAPSSGQLLFNGERLDTKGERELAGFRNRSLGFIFQFHHLLPEFSALENVMMPALIGGARRSQATAPARRLLAAVELDHRQEHRVNELSGGEQQRTALARALIMEPDLLLADEPTGNLDSRAGELVFNLLHDLCRRRGLAVLMVTHNLQLAARMDRRLTLVDGILETNS
ncbi:ABC transporter ATP-binding protein [Desulfofustis glycolicus]|uniref:Lipoprotein-releasing system ATP-binding protein n=1 Tax=Desulfofustis glycolicus DSM 9705 TaxID=1121409 RepID=A0A1M5T506_9BACT|nr:ABC transporter ATP-binding protein [Desulfofustis glycolicus]MCB2215367.1 ABC transporter ATP-binding protein [Desulfobulbaceae bacterium]SHH45829.1 lipoprotein-releasing system ATP-binding protein [Desulfofustis glycolicus DSM 9705]